MQLFQAALGPRPFLTIDSAQVAGHKQLALSLVTSYQNRPFAVGSIDPSGVERTTDVVRDQVTTELGIAVGLFDRFQLGVAVPLHLVMKGDAVTSSGTASGKALSGGGIGDVRVEGKIRALDVGTTNQFMLSVAPGVSLPTGDQDKYQGDRTATGRLRAIGEYRAGDFRTAAMLGVLLRGSSRSFSAKVGNQLLYGVGAEYKIHRDVGLLGELFGRSGLDQFSKFYEDANPVELDAGMRVALPRALSIAAGGGLGFTRGVGSPKFRGFLAIGWAPDFRDSDQDGVPDSEDRCPTEREDRDGFKDDDGCPEPDNDIDGIPDVSDKCPNEAEDFDQFQDEDGCPEADNDADGMPDLNDPCPNAAEDGRGKRPKDGCPSTAEDGDGDGVPDAMDKCPDEPEDRDGFEDYDGCPDGDNDADNIPDQYDGCPDQAEDMDGFQDEDGCPDPDNDKDGFLDKQDKCPLQAETLNGNKDTDGCPDPGAEIVKLAGDKVELRDHISFSAGAKPAVTAASQGTVNLVALLLRGHTEISSLRIDVHAEGSAAIAQARADAVAAALTAKGVEAGRLKPVGTEGPSQVELFVDGRVEQKKAAAPAKE